MTGPNMTQMRPPRGSGHYTPSSKDFTINDTSTTICIDSPSMTIIAYFSCNGTIIGKIWIPGLGFGKSGSVVRDARSVHRKTYCLVRVGVGRSDGGHESNPSSQTIAKVSSACRIKGLFMMGVDTNTAGVIVVHSPLRRMRRKPTNTPGRVAQDTFITDRSKQSLVYASCPEVDWSQLSAFCCGTSSSVSSRSKQQTMSKAWAVKGHGKEKGTLVPKREKE